MSIAVDCGGCTAGNHDHHNRNHGIVDGLIGGTYCACTGDCDERAAEARREFADWWANL